MKRSEFKIGEVFQCGRIKLKCVEIDDRVIDICPRCFFKDFCLDFDTNSLNCMDKVDEITNGCRNRKDKKNVIFVKVTDNNDD